MGMDVYGKKPTDGCGEYFRNSVWGWRPLADYCIMVAPEITNHCQSWHSNDGDGLTAKQAKNLASKIQVEIDTGRCQKFADERRYYLEHLPDKTCEICEGTGVRNPPPQPGPGDAARGGVKCNGCDGTGKTRPWSTMYPFSVKNVQEFVNFLRASGGFEIW